MYNCVLPFTIVVPNFASLQQTSNNSNYYIYLHVLCILSNAFRKENFYLLVQTWPWACCIFNVRKNLHCSHNLLTIADSIMSLFLQKIRFDLLEGKATLLDSVGEFVGGIIFNIHCGSRHL